MTESQIIARLVGAIKDTMRETADSCMLQPFEAEKMAVVIGRYQGMKASLEILDSILRDNDEKERA